MNLQINVRLPENLLMTAKTYADKYGFGTVQELIKETLREKIFGPELTEEEVSLIRRLMKATKEKNLHVSEKELFKKLRE